MKRKHAEESSSSEAMTTTAVMKMFAVDIGEDELEEFGHPFADHVEGKEQQGDEEEEAEEEERDATEEQPEDRQEL
jgi:hypothetical protein